MNNLNFAVRRFLAEARRSPAAAVGTALDELEAEAARDLDGAFVARTSPVATNTWMGRATLRKTQPSTAPDIVAMGMPVEVVGFFPTILALEQGLTVPPLEAIDVHLELNRRDVITARAESGVQAGDPIDVVNLPMISSVVANRLIGWKLSAADPNISIEFRWAVPLAVVTALGWSDIQISLGMFVRRLEE